MEQIDCGHDGTGSSTGLGEDCQSNNVDGGDNSLLNTETDCHGQQTDSTKVAEMPLVSDAVHTELSPTSADHSLNDTDSKSEQKRQGTHSDNELSQKIITQVEYYFSDENLVKDSFLMQRIHRDKRGYVDLKLVASFKKMKKLTQDINVIAAALRSSKKLEINKAASMVRRIAPLPVTKEQVAALKTVVAVNFNETNNLAEQFGVCGTVTSVRIVSKNDAIPSDVRKHLRRSLDDRGRAITPIALIEYDDDKCAQAACESLTDSSDWRHGLHVSRLVARPSEKKSSSPKRESSDVRSHPEQSKKKTNKKNRSRVEAILLDESAGYSSSGSETEGHEDQREHKVSGSKSRARGSSPKGSNSVASGSNFAHSVLAHHNISLADDLRGEVRARSGSTGAIEYGSRGISPWVQRRIQAAKHESKSAEGSMVDLSAGDTASINKATDVVAVMRQPRGPDGTRGFRLLR